MRCIIIYFVIAVLIEELHYSCNYVPLLIVIIIINIILIIEINIMLYVEH